MRKARCISLLIKYAVGCGVDSVLSVWCIHAQGRSLMDLMSCFYKTFSGQHYAACLVVLVVRVARVSVRVGVMLVVC